MQCSNCSASVLPEDQFCEECGTPLTASKPPTATNGCEKCGAGSEAIDHEGYCSNCGFRKEVRESLEITINEHLAGISDRGLRHERNEDYLALQQINDSQTQILVVCDGVSSSEQPELAAQAAAKTACTALANAIQKGEKPDIAMKSAFATALLAVCNIPYIHKDDSEPPSTTIIAAIVEAGTATIGWLGDSRAYWISPNGSRQLTKDDSWLNEVVTAGEMSETEAKKSSHAHAITRWLGADTIDSAEPSIVKFILPKSGYLLLCSDGLWNYAPQAQQIADLTQGVSGKNAIAISRNLVEFARRCGGRDNITVAILSVDSGSQ
jgi:PPM family protein phosphatase